EAPPHGPSPRETPHIRAYAPPTAPSKSLQIARSRAPANRIDMREVTSSSLVSRTSKKSRKAPQMRGFLRSGGGVLASRCERLRARFGARGLFVALSAVDRAWSARENAAPALSSSVAGLPGKCAADH